MGDASPNICCKNAKWSKSRPLEISRGEKEYLSMIVKSAIYIFALIALGVFGVSPALATISTSAGALPCINSFYPSPTTGKNTCITAEGDLSILGVIVGGMFNQDQFVASLTINGGSKMLVGDIFLGNFQPVDPQFSGVGTLNVTGENSVLTAQSLWIGQRDRGTMSVTLGGNVVAGQVFLSTFFGAQGTAFIDGAKSKLRATVGVFVGHDSSASMTISNNGSFDASSAWMVVGNARGTGTLSVRSGGRADLSGLSVGSLAGSNGVVNLSDANSTISFNAGARALVGDSGTGKLNISGGRLLLDRLELGYNAGSVGTVELSGADSILSGVPPSELGTSLGIGIFGTGVLNVRNGATVTSSGAVVGEHSGADGRLLVSGTGATFNLTSGALTVGQRGKGSVTIEGNGAFFAPNLSVLSLGVESGSDGSLTISGQGSQFSRSPSLLAIGPAVEVGRSGKGSFTIQNQAFSMIAGLDAGVHVGSKGEVLVTGTDSKLHVTGGTITLGGFGWGSLRVENGGALNAPLANYIAIGSAFGGSGRLTVVGRSASISFAGNALMDIGRAGNGTLELFDGAELAVGAMGVGAYANASLGLLGKSVGTVKVGVSPANETMGGIFLPSKLSVVGGHLMVGGDGIGTVEVFSGGSVDASQAGAVSIGHGSGGDGTVALRYGGSLSAKDVGIGRFKGSTGVIQLANQFSSDPMTTFSVVGGSLIVGGSGKGTLDVGLGGQVNMAASTFLSIGAESGGDGVLQIQAGGRVSAEAANVAAVAGSKGTVLVDGADATAGRFSEFEVRNGYFVLGHSGGDGKLFIKNGAVFDATRTQGITVGGRGGVGTVEVTGGGFNGSVLAIGYGLGGTGTVSLLSGSHGTLKGSEDRLSVGSWGQGSLVITDSVLDAGSEAGVCPSFSCNVFVGNAAGATGDLSIRGENAGLFAFQSVIVGNASVFNVATSGFDFGTAGGVAHGSVNISEGGRLRATRLVVAQGPGGSAPSGKEVSNGFVTVTGLNSTIELVRNLQTGTQATLALAPRPPGLSSIGSVFKAGEQVYAELNVLDKGKVIIDGSSGGAFPTLSMSGAAGSVGGKSLALIDGGSIEFRGNTGVIQLFGNGGPAEMVVANGGKVFGTGERGLVFASIGNEGKGTLRIEGFRDGTEHASFTLAGDAGPGTGIDNSLATMLTIGRGPKGDGLVQVKAGGKLVIDTRETTSGIVSRMTIGRDAGSTGKLEIDGGVVSLLGARSEVWVGDSGAGTASIAGGSRLQADSIVLGRSVSSTGTFGIVNVGSQGSFEHATLGVIESPPKQPGALLYSDSLTVGGAGSGQLRVFSDGGVSIGKSSSGMPFVQGQNAALEIERGNLLANASSSIFTFGTRASIDVAFGSASIAGNLFHAIDIPTSIASNVAVSRLLSRINGDHYEPTARTGIVEIKGAINVVQDRSVSLDTRASPGVFVPIVVAGSINLPGDGGTTGTMRRLSNPGDPITQFAFVGTTVSSPRVLLDNTNAAYSHGVLAPERLKVNCDVLQFRCDSVLGVRTVAEAVQNTSREPIPDLENIQTATQYVRSKDVRELSFLAAAIYDKQFGPEYKVVSSIEVADLRAFALQRENGIDIVVRGSGPLLNWVADLGFAGVPVPTLREYVYNLSAFAGSVRASNPNVPLTISGHSLGGGLAHIVGNAMGISAIGFNAVPVGNVIDKFSSETAVIEGLVSSPNQRSLLMNVTTYLDPVSGLDSRALPFLGLKEGLQRVGQTITLMGDPMLYLIQNKISSIDTSGPNLSDVDRLKRTRLKAYLEVLASFPEEQAAPTSVLRWIDLHSSLTVLSSVNKGSPVLRYQRISEGSFREISPADVTSFAISEALSHIRVPDQGSVPGKSYFNMSVSAGTLEMLDPIVADGYSFSTMSDGPRFAGVLLPFISLEGEDYDVETLLSGSWALEGTARSGDFYTFKAGSVAEFRLRGAFRSLAGRTNLVEPMFGVVFDASGDTQVVITALDVNGAPLPVPEPSTYMMLLLGVLLITCVVQARGRAANTYARPASRQGA